MTVILLINILKVLQIISEILESDHDENPETQTDRVPAEESTIGIDPQKN